MPIILTKVSANRETTTHPSKTTPPANSETPVETTGETAPKINTATEKAIKEAAAKKGKK